MIYIGTSGWQYRDWRGPFYPPDLAQRKWLSFYARTFTTTEVNNSFYRLPAEGTFQRWRDATPDGFLMAVKASRFLTHLRRLRDPRQPVDLLWQRATELGERLGPVLFQLPPRFPVDPTRLRELLRVLPSALRPAIEFRDPSWYTSEVFGLLEQRHAALVWPDRPGARISLPCTADWAYIRFHQGTAGGAGYRRDKLRRWADRTAALPVEASFLYFNNDPGGAAVRDAGTMIDLLRERRVEVALPSTPAAEETDRRGLQPPARGNSPAQ